MSDWLFSWPFSLTLCWYLVAQGPLALRLVVWDSPLVQSNLVALVKRRVIPSVDKISTRIQRSSCMLHGTRYQIQPTYQGRSKGVCPRNPFRSAKSNTAHYAHVGKKRKSL
ncbi:hypothetical protein BDW02DRAFT_242244 [Decorospora gaudefroyi]|uniref:Uncharacterized protein n=1 Tax=Decorospora gaudefroyi TaxID=184978 RepID=A0A6A5KE49_9PLEO|nr:hypothetical protein BDW02DRAFT_242244 [Decorospora gaudefroyi]